MTQLSNRQKMIVQFILERETASNREIVAFFESNNEPLSRETVARELSELLSSKAVIKIGKGRSVRYALAESHPLLKPLDYESYLAKDPDVRSPGVITFDLGVMNMLPNLLSREEIAELEKGNSVYRTKIQNLPAELVKKEIERITIELAWKSSRIEGNTYSLIDTEILIKEQREARGHAREEAIMILNHKKALDYILKNKSRFERLNLREVENVHRLLVLGLSVSFGLRNRPVGITGTNYRPLDNKHQIEEVTERMVGEINSMGDPWSKSLASLLMLSYIQAFEDGNKRTSRLIANACLIAGEACPLSFRSIDEAEYKKAILLFYELRNASLLKKLFLEQCAFSLRNYFL